MEFGVNKEEVDSSLKSIFLHSSRAEYLTLYSLGQVFSAFNVKLWLQSTFPAGTIPFIVGGMTAQMRHKALLDVLGQEVQTCSADKWMDKLESERREDDINRICAHIYKQCQASVSKVQTKPNFKKVKTKVNDKV